MPIKGKAKNPKNEPKGKKPGEFAKHKKACQYHACAERAYERGDIATGAANEANFHLQLLSQTGGCVQQQTNPYA